MSDVSSVINYFSTANEGFITTLGGSILSGAATVPLTTTSGLTNGTVFVGLIEPGLTKQQVFTGIVDTGGAQITNVVWTRGTNADHTAGVTIVDYVTGTAHNMMSTGILKTLNQDGTLKTSIVTTAKIANANVTPDKLSVAARTMTVATAETTTATSYSDLATTTDTVTATIGANGLALVIIGAAFSNNGANVTFIDFATSGANTRSATDSTALEQGATSQTFGMTRTTLLTGLTAGSTVFKMKYRVTGGTGSFSNRSIAVIPL